jgi:curved DNA-binding protein
VEYKDYYKTLGVAKTASEDEIKKAYRKLVRKYHPDVSKEADAQQKTQELNEAYGVLGDAEKRAAYDDLGRGQHYREGQEFRPPPDWGRTHGGGGFGGMDSDFFADLFANLGGGRRRQARPRKGDDSHASIAIDDGQLSGRQPQHHCVCHGSRWLPQRTHADGEYPQGYQRGPAATPVRSGAGGAGGPGDLYLEVEFRPHPRYRVEGRDVYASVPVTPWELALGGEIEVNTPSGKLTVNVPAGSQTGRKLRLRGRGLPAKEAGDLYLLLEVALPPATSEKGRAVYEAMARSGLQSARRRLNWHGRAAAVRRPAPDSGFGAARRVGRSSAGAASAERCALGRGRTFSLRCIGAASSSSRNCCISQRVAGPGSSSPRRITYSGKLKELPSRRRAAPASPHPDPTA